MSAVKTILLDVAFWKKFSESSSIFKEPVLDSDYLKSLRSWTNMFSFISRSTIKMDCTPIEFTKLTEEDEKLKYLWKQSTDNASKLSLGEDFNDKKQLFQSNYSALYLSGDDESDTQQYGIINCTPKRYDTIEPLFKDNGIALKGGQTWSWKQLSEIVPFKQANSMIIADSYIFSNNREDINLQTILDTLLPETSSLPFDLSIFYKIKESFSNEPIEDAINRGKKKEEAIKDFLNTKRGNLNINLEFFQSKPSDYFYFHDRSIVTNNYFIGSGSGFGILVRDEDHYKRFKQVKTAINPKKSTTVQIAYPYIASEIIKWIDDGYENVINDAKLILQNQKLTSSNRLLQ